MNYKLAKLNDGNGQLDKQWFVYYYYVHPESGKYVRFRKWISNRIKTKTGRRAKAQEYINHINAQLRRGWNPFAEAETRLTNVVEALEFAMNLKAQTITTRGKYTYSSVLRIFIRWLKKNHFDKMAIEDMNSRIAREFCDHMLLYEKISPRTYNNRIGPLKTLFGILHKREYLLFNPFGNIEKLRVPEPEISAYLPNELIRIKSTLPAYNYQLYVITQLIFYCFLRPAEIVRLQFKDLLWDHDLIVMPGTKTKNKKSQVITIPEKLKSNLKDWNRNFPEEYYLFSRKLKPGNFMIAPTRIAEAWRKYGDKFGIKKGIYDFKHTGNGYAFDQGFNARDIQLQNRHASLDETQKYLDKFRRIPSEDFKTKFSGY